MTSQDLEKVQQYFEAALELPQLERAEFLVQLATEEPDIFQEVKALLQADAGPKAWDKTRVRPAPSPAGVGKLEEIGPYRILEQIGSGGMGVIYRAHDQRLQRDVALKFLPASMNADPDIRQRFLSEARAASQLDHANICVVHDFGESPDGQLYIIMPYYQGETLSARLQRGALAYDEALNICHQVADGLARAHSHNIVHRDIKPSNIMLTADGGIKVLDFGIAKVANSNLTGTGMSIGTLAYMSPEQLRGEEVDARTDIWALGVVLFEMITGSQAFSAKALPDILQAVLHDADNTVAAQASQLPEPVHQLLSKSMVREPGQRFADMNQMIDAITQAVSLLSHNPTAAPANDISLNSAGKSRSYDWDEQLLERIGALLIPVLGPIAPTLVKRKAKQAADLEELSHMLAESLPDQTSQQNLLKEMQAQIAAYTTPPVPRGLKTDGSLTGIDLSAAQLAALEEALIAHLGPITQTLIKRHASSTSSIESLLDTLAQHIHNDEEKQKFIQAIKKRLE